MKHTTKNIIAGLALGALFGLFSVSAQAANITKCYGCHGTKFEKKALGKSQIVKDLNSTQIVEALNGYQKGTYGGSMKMVMKGQIKDLNETQIVDVAKAIKNLSQK